jgi:2-amino-4-hydroxy-6-hydroxymethyldihydropteridine diphosphokinase
MKLEVTHRNSTASNNGPLTRTTNLINHAYIGLGSNLGDRAGYLLLAVRGMLESGLQPVRLSRIYETAPIGNLEQPKFLNMVAEIDGSCLPAAEQLLARLLRIEYALGRTREVPLGPRTIDLDLLLYKSAIIKTEFLTVPHPRMHLRRFVLEPLKELCPKLVHPTLKVAIDKLLEQTNDTSDVHVWSPSK